MNTRRRRTSAGTWLNDSRSPMFMLDKKRRFILFNSGCEELTGWSADEVLGQRADFAIEEPNNDLQRLTNGLCPPPEVFDGQPCSVPAYIASRQGSPAARVIQFFPLANDVQSVDHVLGVITALDAPTARSEASPSQVLHAELAAMRTRLRQRFGLHSLIGRCSAMQRVYQQVQLARGSLASVFLHGDSGTGREHIARVVHYESESRNLAFVPLDSKSNPAIDLKLSLRRMLTENSGDTPGSHLRPGTLYFSHLEDLSRDVQETILDFFGPEAVQRDVRLIASSASSLDDLVTADTLIPDVAYLFTTLTIALPPLQARDDDVSLLAQYFLELANSGQERQVAGFDADVLQQFARYNWPGNLAELRSVVTKARENTAGHEITPEDLPFPFRAGVDAQRTGPSKAARPVDLDAILHGIETEHITAALAACNDNKSKAATLLGMTRAKLYRRMEQLGIEI